MDNDKFQIYSECLTSIFEKVKKYVSKRHPNYNELMAFIKDYSQKILSDKNKELNSDSYFPYMKMALESENKIIIECVIENMMKLIKEDLLLGNSDDIGTSPSEKEILRKENTKGFHFALKRKMSDAMVDAIVGVFSFNDENLWLSCGKLLQVMYMHPKIGIHNESMLKMFKFCIRIHLTSRISGNIDSTKSCLNSMLLFLFTQMEKSQAAILLRESSIKYPTIFTDMEDKENSIYLTSKSATSNSNDRSGSGSENSTLSGFQMYTSICPVYRNPVDTMVNRIVKNIVDNICIYNVRCLSSANTLTIPVTSVPPFPEESASTDALYYRRTFNPMIINEHGFPSGIFGWCFICRNKADFYCKDTRKPICSFECKQKLLDEEEKISKYLSGELINEDDVALLYLSDCVNLFKSLCKFFNVPLSNSNESFNSRAKMLALESILGILDKPGNTLLTQKDFIRIIKEDLTDGLLRNCVSDDSSIFSMTLAVFSCTWQHYREHLKQQISVFIETVFLKILDSGNSSYHHKYTVLDHFFKQSATPRYFVELYANYDCDIEEKFLVNRIVTSLSKIAQGKYAKTEHSLTPMQEYNLRFKALETIVLLVKSILMFTLDQVGVFVTNGGEREREREHEEPNGGLIFNQDESVSDEQFSLTELETVSREKIDINLKMKHEIQTAVEKFNINIKSGIAYLKKVGLVSKDDKDKEARDIAHFLRNSNGLKKEYMGDLLGENNEVALKVLKYYTEAFDFSKMHIIEAIRIFLSSFHLPGEGQKIDRIMEKFASKYYSDNPGIYETADCTYYLAFAIIMIQTDIHNPEVKRKMGYEGFCKLLKGQNGGKDLDPGYLLDIYNQILNKPITLVEYEEQRDKMDVNQKKQELYKRESERMFIEGSEKLKMGKNKFFMKICEIEYITPLMGSIWTALLAMFSLTLEESDEPQLYMPCIEGTTNCIKLLGILNMDLQKEAMIKGFCKITSLLQGKEIKDKHISCIKAIFNLASVDGRYLRGSWKNILELISTIDYYHMVISGSRSGQKQFFNDVKMKKRGSNADKDILIERNNMDRIAKEISPDDYEIIFHNTIRLDDNSILDFVKSLCEISRDELSKNDLSRIFSLQKLVEVAEMNMNRVRLAWSTLWNIISEYLTEVASNSSSEIAEKAVDSLRQLAKKFLQKEEGSEYHFQIEFLRPFENILINNLNVYNTKEYVMTCITNLVLAEASSIKSGWKIIFNIFQLASQDSSSDIIRKTFDTLVKVSTYHFPQVKENFIELANCIQHFSFSFPEDVINIYSTTLPKLDDISYIYAVLSGLAGILSDARENVRIIGCNAVFQVINTICMNFYANVYISTNIEIGREFWGHVLNKILVPIIDELIDEKYASTLESLLIEVCCIADKYYNSFENSLLEDFLRLLSSICANDNETIAMAGIEALRFLLGRDNLHENSKFWELIISTISSLLDSTRQHEFLELDVNKFDDPNFQNFFQEIVSKNIVYCIIQHNLIELSDFIVDHHITKIPEDNLFILLKCLRASFELAYTFNTEFNLRREISSHFMRDLNQTAALFKQQQDGTGLYFKILNKMYDMQIFSPCKPRCRNQMIEHSLSILKQFVECVAFSLDGSQDEELVIENERLVNTMVPGVIEEIVPTLIKIKFYKDKEYLDSFTQCFLEMIPCNIIEVRFKVKEILAVIFKVTQNGKIID